MIFKFTGTKCFAVTDTVVLGLRLEDRYFTEGLIPQGFEGFFHFNSMDEAKEYFENSYDESLVVSAEDWIAHNKSVYEEKLESIIKLLDEEPSIDEEMALNEQLIRLNLVYDNGGNPYTINWDLLTQEPTE
jgi:hypothetical protein